MKFVAALAKKSSIGTDCKGIEGLHGSEQIR